jgi:phage baseplate assembly protein W
VDAVLPDLLPDREEGGVMNDPGRVLGRGIAFPPRLGPDGRLALSEGEQNVREAIEVVLRTEPGERPRRPGFGGGVERLLFEPNAPLTHRETEQRIAEALGSWEPRIAVSEVEVEPDTLDPEAATATIAFKLIATQVRASITVAGSGTG